MAAKGDRARLEPVARQMYVDGKSLIYIEETLEVSRQTLAEWRDYAAWDKAKAAKDNYEAQLVEVRDKLMEQIKTTPLQAGSYLDSLSKVEAILDKRARSQREAAEAIARQKGEMFLDFVKGLIEYGGKHAPALVVAVEDNFDDIISWGRDKWQV